PTPEPTTPVPAPEAPAPAAYSVVKPLNAQETKAVKQLKAQLKKVDGKKLTQRQAADLALTIATVFGK
ncbi:MAG: hypothetical protein ABIS86_11850, partial [Streptosporangiaceae bacterium]